MSKFKCQQVCPFNTLSGCKVEEYSGICPMSNSVRLKEKPMTNADRIRAMSDEELAEWIVRRTVYSESAWSAPSYLNLLTCRDDTYENALAGSIEWLKQPAKEDA